MSNFQRIITSPMAVLKLAVALCYMALGVYLYLNTDLLYFLDKGYRPYLGGLFVFYGAFRLYRAITD